MLYSALAVVGESAGTGKAIEACAASKDVFQVFFRIGCYTKPGNYQSWGSFGHQSHTIPQPDGCDASHKQQGTSLLAVGRLVTSGNSLIQ
jgi:carbohydrate-selective porin OprB